MDCDPVTTVSDLKPHQRFAVATYTEADHAADPSVVVGARKPLDPDAPAIPCGLIAKSMFTDTYRLFKVEENIEGDTVNVEIPIA